MNDSNLKLLFLLFNQRPKTFFHYISKNWLNEKKSAFF